MNFLFLSPISRFSFKTVWLPVVVIILHLNSHSAFSQSEFNKANRDKAYKKGTNTEYYKNGNVKLISDYKRKVFWYYTDTYWTIKEYDMDGNLIRLTKKITQTARRENREVIIKEEIIEYPPKKEGTPKETIRPEE